MIRDRQKGNEYVGTEMHVLTTVVVRNLSKLSIQFSWKRCEQLSSTSLLLALPLLTVPLVGAAVD